MKLYNLIFIIFIFSPLSAAKSWYCFIQKEDGTNLVERPFKTEDTATLDLLCFNTDFRDPCSCVVYERSGEDERPSWERVVARMYLRTEIQRLRPGSGKVVIDTSAGRFFAYLTLMDQDPS